MSVLSVLYVASAGLTVLRAKPLMEVLGRQVGDNAEMV